MNVLYVVLYTYPRQQESIIKDYVLLGCIYSLDCTTGLDYWTGLLDSLLTPKVAQISAKFSSPVVLF